MRSKRTFYLILLLISFWIIITIFLLNRNGPSLSRINNNLAKKIVSLEESVNHETILHHRLVENLVGVLKQKQDLDSRFESENGGSNNNNVESVIKEIPLDVSNKTRDKKYSKNFTGPIIPVLVFACNRESVSKCLDNLIEHQPNVYQFPIIVSQDCDHELTRNKILSYKDKVTLISQPDQSDIFVPPKEKKFKGYYKIARHYGWALNHTFQQGYDYVIIVEDDLNVSPDFYEYFLSTYSLLKNDPSLWYGFPFTSDFQHFLIISLYILGAFPLGMIMVKRI